MSSNYENNEQFEAWLQKVMELVRVGKRLQAERVESLKKGYHPDCQCQNENLPD